MDNGSLKQTNRHQAVVEFFHSLPEVKDVRPEDFNKILGLAASAPLRILAKIPPHVYDEMIKRFKNQAWVITNFSDDQIKLTHYIYNGPKWTEKENYYKTFQTIEWQVFEYLQKMRELIAKKQAQMKSREIYLRELVNAYDEINKKKDLSQLTEDDLIKTLNFLNEKGIITKQEGESKEPGVFYFKHLIKNSDGSRQWEELRYVYSGPRKDCLEKRFFLDLQKFKRIILENLFREREKIRQERIQHQSQYQSQFQHDRGGPRHVFVGGSKKCAKAEHAEMKAKGVFGEKNKKQRKWEKKHKKWIRKREKLEKEKEFYLGLSDDEE